MSNYDSSNIVALASANGSGAISIIRLSGDSVISIVDSFFVPFGAKRDSIANDKKLVNTASKKMVFGSFYNGVSLLDECMVAVFRAPASYTGEDGVEIYCHGSSYIVSEIIKALISKGVSLAKPGEFSKRAFLNGKMDLAQAEAVADLIASETESAHAIAMQQMRGEFSNELRDLREQLLNLVSLMELELDFSEEDVEFADRNELSLLVDKALAKLSTLIESFSLGNVIKNGVPVAIVGATNTGKSTLLNSLLGEEKAIVSNIHGTTRDVIEDIINLGGISFRFIDTAGIRETKETIEIIGIERTYQKLKQASVVIMVLDATRSEFFNESLINLSKRLNKDKQKLVIVLNKIDNIVPSEQLSSISCREFVELERKDYLSGRKSNFNTQLFSIESICKEVGLSPISIIPIVAKDKLWIECIKELLINSQKNLSVSPNSTLVSNIRHYEALLEAQRALDRTDDGIRNKVPSDLVAQDIREAIFHLGEIVGEISTEEVLGNIFGRFCIGK